MKITVSAGSWARLWLPQGQTQLELPANAVAQDTLAALGIPPAEVGLFAVNGTTAPSTTALSDGDVVRIFPVIMGG